jgi:serine/threonine protein kinase
MGLTLLDVIMKFDDAKDNFKPDKRKKVGDYVLGKTLGEGTFAKVRSATHIISKEKVIGNYFGNSQIFSPLILSSPIDAIHRFKLNL